VDEQHEEKMFQLGSVYQRVHDEYLDPCVKRVISILYRQSEPFWARGEDGPIPIPPEALQGMELEVIPISIMETIQKMMGTTGVERFFGFAGAQAALDPSVLDKIDFDKSLDNYADMVSLPPDILSSTEVVEAKRAARAKQQQMAALAAAADPVLKGAKAAEALGGAGLPVDVASGLAGQPLNQGVF
jgi:hypothetical protein